MNNRLQTTIIAVAILIAAAILWNNLARINPNNATDKTVSVAGEGKANLVPDIYEFSITASEKWATTKDVNKALAKKTEAAQKILKDYKIEDKDIQSQNVNISENRVYENSSSKIDGYVGTHTLSIKVRAMDNAGKLIDDLTSIDGLLVNGGNYTSDDDSIVLQQARKDAFEKAHSKAQELAQLAGMKLGKVVSLNEDISWGGYPQPMYDMKAIGMGGDAESSTNINPGEKEYIVNVYVIYELK